MSLSFPTHLPSPCRPLRSSSLRLALLAGVLSLAGCKPEAGGQGPSGETGPQGQQGAAGAQGPAGPVGPAGAAGRGLAVDVEEIFDGGPCLRGGLKISMGYDANQNGELDDAEFDEKLLHYVCDGLDGEEGAVGAVGPQGPEGQAGPQGPSGLVASRFVSWAGSRTLAPDTAHLVDVLRLEGSAEGRVTLDRPARLLAHATVLLTPDLSKTGIAGEGRCGLFVPNGAPTSEENPEAGFDRMGNFVHFSYQSPTAAHLHNNVVVPLVGALDRPAGTYDVVVKCQGLGQFNQLYTLWSSDLSVTAAVK